MCELDDFGLISGPGGLGWVWVRPYTPLCLPAHPLGPISDHEQWRDVLVDLLIDLTGYIFISRGNTRVEGLTLRLYGRRISPSTTRVAECFFERGRRVAVYCYSSLSDL